MVTILMTFMQFYGRLGFMFSCFNFCNCMLFLVHCLSVLLSVYWRMLNIILMLLIGSSVKFRKNAAKTGNKRKEIHNTLTHTPTRLTHKNVSFSSAFTDKMLDLAGIHLQKCDLFSRLKRQKLCCPDCVSQNILTVKSGSCVDLVMAVICCCHCWKLKAVRSK